MTHNLHPHYVFKNTPGMGDCSTAEEMKLLLSKHGISFGHVKKPMLIIQLDFVYVKHIWFCWTDQISL